MLIKEPLIPLPGPPGRGCSRPLPKLAEVEAALGTPASSWAGHCHETACAIVEAGLVDGVAVYGEWLGPIAGTSSFAHRQAAPFGHHGWIVLDDGRVLDPTRWAFEGTTPYLYVGPAGPEYDEGGNRVRRMQLGPPPSERPQDRIASTDTMSPVALEAIRGLLGHPRTITIPMLAWVANLPVDAFGAFAAVVYDALAESGYGALIPDDNLALVARRAPRPSASP